MEWRAPAALIICSTTVSCGGETYHTLLGMRQSRTPMEWRQRVQRTTLYPSFADAAVREDGTSGHVWTMPVVFCKMHARAVVFKAVGIYSWSYSSLETVRRHLSAVPREAYFGDDGGAARQCDPQSHGEEQSHHLQRCLWQGHRLRVL